MKKNIIFIVACLAFTALPQTLGATTTPAIEVIKPVNGSLVKGEGPKVYLITENGEKSWIPDAKTFEALGHSWLDIMIVSENDLDKYPTAEPQSTIEKQPIITTVAESEAAVRAYFIDIPEMISIAECESRFRQFNNDGTPLKGSGRYIGVFQIDENIHAQVALGMDMDIFTLEGNLAYARHLFELLNIKPWPTCGKKTSTAGTGQITANLKIGDKNEQVKLLQQRLNALGFKIAETGSGSAGNETTYFGTLTREAVKKFQCAKNIVCSGDESTTGFGLVGPKTKAAL